ncbi:hypothetical protein [Gordonia sp. GN26]
MASVLSTMETGDEVCVLPANFDEWALQQVEQRVDEELQRLRAERAATARRVHDPATEWFKGRRLMFLDLSRNVNNKPPSRAGYYAWAKHNRDGHCPLEDGELQRIVGKPDMTNGDVMRRIIKPAVEMGLLDQGSVRTCLIVPDGVWFDYGARTKSCEHHRAGTFAAVSHACFGESRRQT